MMEMNVTPAGQRLREYRSLHGTLYVDHLHMGRSSLIPHSLDLLTLPPNALRLAFSMISTVELVVPLSNAKSQAWLHFTASIGM